MNLISKRIKIYSAGLLLSFFVACLVGVIPLFIGDVVSFFPGGSPAVIFLAQLAMWLMGIVLVSFFLGIVLNPYMLRILRTNIPIKNLPPEFNGYRIVHISDIHSGTFIHKRTLTQMVEKIKSEKADLVVFTGDIINGRAEELAPYLSLLSQLPGTLAVLGNHDYGDYISWKNAEEKERNHTRLREMITSIGWRLLINEHAKITKNDSTLYIAGVENWSASTRFPRYGKIQSALVDIPQDAPTILLSHDPSHWRKEVLDTSVALTLSGHTHGMQLGIYQKKRKWSPAGWFYKEWAGLYTEKDQHLYVNVGIGMVGYPGRVGMWPEITVHTLVQKTG